MKVQVILFLFCFTTAFGQNIPIYNADSTLTAQYLELLCEAASDYDELASIPLELEVLMNKAAGTFYRAPNQRQKFYNWWSRHFKELYCTVKKKNKLHLGRLIIENDIREIANELGPHGRLSIDVGIKDLNDGLTFHEYAKSEREKIQFRYKNQTLKFQKNKKWKNYTFYMLLFTEYEVQWEVLLDKQKN